MQLFNISDRGELIRIDTLNFEEDDVYLVDDEKKNRNLYDILIDKPKQKFGLIIIWSSLTTD